MHKFFQFLLIAFISLFLLEICSFLMVWVLAKQSGNQHLAYHVSQFHPLFSGGIERSGEVIPPYRRADDSNPFRYDPRTSYTNRPGKVYGGDGGLPIDSLGFICNGKCLELPREKTASEVRIFLFGGSTVAGVGVSHGSDTISAQLERLLNGGKEYPDGNVRVVNAGVGGFFSGQELDRLINEILFYQPDAVIFLDGLNDYHAWQFVQFDPYVGRYAGKLRPNLVEYDYQIIEGLEQVQSPAGALLHTANILTDSFPVLYYAATLAKHIRTNMAGWNSTRDSTIVRGHTPAQLDDLRASMHGMKRNNVDTYVTNLASAAGVAREHNLKALMCLQPTLGFGSKKPIGKELTNLENMFEHSPYKDLFFTVAQATLLKYHEGNDSSVRYCDLTTIFDALDREIYVDHGHYNAYGNRLIAAALLRQLKPFEIEPAQP